MMAEEKMVEVEEEKKEEIQGLTPVPGLTGGAAVEEVQETVTVAQEEQAAGAELEELVEKVEIRVTVLLVTERWGQEL